MLSNLTPDSGRLLISEPFMMDPNFRRSVILLTEYSAAGSMGFVMNHQSEYLLGDLLPDLPYSELPVYLGGPVGEDTLHFIHHCPEKIEDGIEIAKGVFWGGNFETVKDLITNYQITEDEIRFFAGYSGWTPRQLDDEIAEDTWIVTDKYTPEILFAANDQNIWRQVVIGLGQRYAHIANFPENPEMN